MHASSASGVPSPHRNIAAGWRRATGGHCGISRGGVNSFAVAHREMRANRRFAAGTLVAVDGSGRLTMIEITRILCPVDFSEHSEHALRFAIKLGKWYGAGIHVLHVMAPMPPSTTSPIAEARRQLSARNLAGMIDRWREPDVAFTSELIESAGPAARIVEIAEAIDADLVVTGSHGRSGVKRVLLGSVVEPLLHRCRRPVLVVPAGLDLRRLQGPVSFARILCAVDFAGPSLSALAYAFSLAEESDAQLTLLSVIDVPPELAWKAPGADLSAERVRAEAEAERVARLNELVPEHARDYCTVQAAVLEGGVSRQILRLAAAQNEDLIVIGVHGRNALDLAVFGSNSKDVVVRAHCPVLIVPAGPMRGRLRAVS
jgi:nucleotide-binding universal stress UspA family protein